MAGTLAFISYAREDLDAARRLYWSLQEMGLRPWLDKECLRPGQQWKTEIRRAIKQSGYFILLLSSRSVSRKGFVHKELTEALELLDMHPDSEIYLIPVRLDECEPPRERLRDLHWVDLFPDWNAGVAKLCSSFVLARSEMTALSGSNSVGPLVIIVEKYRDSRLPELRDASVARDLCTLLDGEPANESQPDKTKGRQQHGSAAEIYFSVKNTSSAPISVYDLGLEEVDVIGAAKPTNHLVTCRVTLEASLARQGEDGETIPLFSAWCWECWASDRIKARLLGENPDVILAAPHRHEATLLFHSVIGADRVLNLAPAEAESFRLKLVADTGCSTVRTQFRITALYHDSTGRKGATSSSRPYLVEFHRETARIEIASL